jgi:ParB-like chromosome segregation protein Spo0J
MNNKKSSVPALQYYPKLQQIEQWPVDKLIPYAKIPRTQSDGQVAQLCASIAEFGFNCPTLANTNAGIIAGHGRLAAERGVTQKAQALSREKGSE